MPTLYDASRSTLPSEQGWLSFGTLGMSFGTVGKGTQTRSSNGTILNSTAQISDFAGYSNYLPIPRPTLVNSAFPRLDRSVGYSLDFRVRLINETHERDSNRAGFSVTLLDQGSTPQGIELGFWTNSIFSQEGGTKPFERAAGRVEVNTTVATTYSLRMLDQNYYLLAGNRLVLSGAVQDYSAAAPDSRLPFPPYKTPNLLFLGDNTSRASATVELGNVSLNLASTGTSAANTFLGTPNADLYNGLAGADALNGANGDDWLAGGADTDTLSGGGGDDVLIGGPDADVFLFSSGAAFNSSQLGRDTIVDFSPESDRIRLSRKTFTALPANPSLAVVSSDAAAATSNAAVVYNNSTGSLFYNPNLTAAGFSSNTGGGGIFAEIRGGANATAVPTLTSSAIQFVA